MADQMGHIALGLLGQFIVVFLLTHVAPLVGLKKIQWANAIALIATSAIVAFWEYAAYSVSKRDGSKGLFTLDETLLLRNAVIATVYMVFGVLVGYGFHLENAWAGAALFVVLAVASVFCAPYWLRQKIIWQKASLRYQSRLADMNANISPQDAELIQRFVDEPFEPGAPRQIIIAGPIGSGRTPMVSAIGTEHAFKGRKLRYLSFDMLMEISDQHANASPGGQFPPIGSWGPKNIFYWQWFEAQTLIVDDVSPVIGTAVQAGGAAALTEILETGFGKIET
jgi:hypothetical protein